MEKKRIESPEDPLFAPMWTLYRSSFPDIEQRTPEHQRTALRSARYHLNVYTETDTLVGFVGYWEFDDYLYVEHLAVDPRRRGGGYGSRIMKDLIASTSKTLLLEIEPVKDDLTARRLQFYERLGFRINPYRHLQHAYREDDPQDFPMKVLSYPESLPQPMYERFNRDMKQVVMKRD